MSRKVLLIEPNYKNKYPPMPLMKLATYYRRCGDDVRFFKGDLREFAAQLLCEKLYRELKDTGLACHFDTIKNYIKIGRLAILEDIPDFQDNEYYVSVAKDYRLQYMNKNFKFFDVVAVTTLFTFYWKQTIETINFCKLFVKKSGNLYVGGIAASILPHYMEEETGIVPFKGLLDKPGMLDTDNADIIDELPLDYSILEEIEYVYPAHDAYYGYMTRGCVRNCPFCAVKRLEPNYKNYLSIKDQIEHVNEHFGAQTNLLLMDNNIFASNKFFDIVDEIKDCGYQKGASFLPPNEYEITYNNIKDRYNERAYIKKMIKLYDRIAERLTEDEAGDFYSNREIYDLLYLPTATRSSILRFDSIVRPLYEKHFKRVARKRSLDFNQGIDARLVTDAKMKNLSELAINPLRIAFDHYEQKDIYVSAIQAAARHGITHLSNYLLYNYEDTPDELYYRMKINVDLCEELNVTIYSFPMKYHPIDDPIYFRNRDFIGKYWNRKFIRAIQAVLNATKGKMGRGKDFFEEAFGQDIHEFHKLLWMPETFIIYRRKYDAELRQRLSDRYVPKLGEDSNLTNEWWRKFSDLSPENRNAIEPIIAANDFISYDESTLDGEAKDVLSYYKIKC